MTGAAAMPAAQVRITAQLVRELLATQHPDLADRPLRRVANGWDNVVYRLGGDLAVRLPRRELGASCLANEVRWLPEVGALPLPVPVVVRAGQPGAGYPWLWAVCRWVSGRSATQAPPTDFHAAAAVLADFQRQLHGPAPAAAPRNPVRGIALAARQGHLDRAVAVLPGAWTPQLAAIWAHALAAPAHSGPPLWLHGDPHPGNLITRAGRLAGVIDFGDMCAGDPATDLAIAWLGLPLAAHDPLREHAGELGPGTWDRARGWALCLALAIAANSADNPEMAQVAAQALARLAVES